MNNKFGKNELYEMINSGLIKLTEEEILDLITEELNKENTEVDMDYVDLCYDLLEIKRNNEINNTALAVRKKTKRPIKVLLIAALFVFVAVSTLAVSAQVFNFNISQKIAELINGNAEIDMTLEFANTKADMYNLSNSQLALELAEHNISPVTFPKEMITENCSISNIDYSSEDNTVSSDAVVHFKYKNQYGKMMIRQFNNDYQFVGSWSEMGVVSGQTISSNGMDILIFERDDSCSIIYRDNLTEYNIYLESDIETAIKFAESIK